MSWNEGCIGIVRLSFRSLEMKNDDVPRGRTNPSRTSEESFQRRSTPSAPSSLSSPYSSSFCFAGCEERRRETGAAPHFRRRKSSLREKRKVVRFPSPLMGDGESIPSWELSRLFRSETKRVIQDQMKRIIVVVVVVKPRQGSFRLGVF